MFQGIKLLNFNEASMEVTNLKAKRIQANTVINQNIMQAVAQQKAMIRSRNNAIREQQLAKQQAPVVQEPQVIQPSSTIPSGIFSLASHLQRINQK